MKDEEIPITASAITKGARVNTNAFTTDILPSPSFYSLFLDDHSPTAKRYVVSPRYGVGA